MPTPAFYLKNTIPALPRQPPNFNVSMNERLILDLVRRNGATTRADLARETDLTRQSVTRIADGLSHRGFLKFGETVVSGPGKPSTVVRLSGTAAYSIGFSIMPDAVAAVLMDLTGKPVAQQVGHLPSPERDAIFDLLGHLYGSLVETHVPDPLRVCGVGIAVAGYFIGERNQLNPPEPLGALAMFDIDREVTRRLQLPVWIENSSRAAAVAESLNGVGRKYGTFAYLSHETGFGGAMVIENELFRGASGNAGELSGILAPDLLQKRPTLELLRVMLAEHGREFSDIYGMLEEFDVEWPGVQGWIETVRPQMNRVITAISAVFDPEAIVIGGGRMPSALARRLLGKLQYFDGPKRRGHHQPRPELVISEVEGDAMAIGAASIPLKATFFI